MSKTTRREVQHPVERCSTPSRSAAPRREVRHPVEVLSFQDGTRQATIVTDGERHKSFEMEHSQDHPTLTKAIAYLESKGYRIVPDVF